LRFIYRAFPLRLDIKNRRSADEKQNNGMYLPYKTAFYVGGTRKRTAYHAPPASMKKIFIVFERLYYYD